MTASDLQCNLETPDMNVRKMSSTYFPERRADEFLNSQSVEHPYLHIGMYLGWVIDNNLYSRTFEDEASTEIFRFRRKEMSCTALSVIWRNYLTVEHFNRQGISFSMTYFTSGLFHQDFDELLRTDLPSLEHVHDTWSNYENLKMRFNMRYAEWHKLKSFFHTLAEDQTSRKAFDEIH